MRAALYHGTCLQTVTNNGNSPENCLPLRPYVKKVIDNDCELSKPIPLTENLGMIEPIRRLLDCNPITYLNAVACPRGFEPKTMDNKSTFHIQSKLTGDYLIFDHHTEIVYANGSIIDPSYRQVWGLGWASDNLGQTVRNVQINKHFSMQDKLQMRGGDTREWESFSFEKKARSNYTAIKKSSTW